MSVKRNLKTICICLAFMFACIIPAVSAAEPGQGPAPEIENPSHYFVATYFHNTVRCPTCHKLEELSNEAIENHFSEELKNKTLVWRIINVDHSGNEHYNQDYQLYTKSLIISEVKDGKEIRWKNLEKIWTYVRDEAQFDQYVASEISGWMRQQ